tara:strand:- start:1932 stop:2948 length:1017 start_codon:yes stop_codon:yes gene_type:complete
VLPESGKARGLLTRRCFYFAAMLRLGYDTDMRLLWISSVLLLAACNLQADKGGIYNPDEEFAKLEGPDVATFQESLERNAFEALSAGEAGRAAGLYQQLADKDPNEARYWLGLAESMRRDRAYAESVPVYDKVIEMHPGHLDAYEGKALALMADGKTQEAGKIFERIVQRDPKRWRTLNALGILFAIKNMPTESVRYLQEAVKYYPDNPSVINNLGLVYASQRQYDSAVQLLQEAAGKADPGQVEQIELNLALVYGIMGNMAQAERIAERHLPAGSLENNMGFYAHLANDQELAKSYLNMALSGSPIYYERAWKNLEIIAREEKTAGPSEPGKRIKIQ